MKDNANNQIRKAAAGFFFPRRLCACCGAESPQDILCPDCRKAQSRLRSCQRCASFLGAVAADGLCESCRRKQPPFVLARAALPYEGFLRHSLLSFKYLGKTGKRRALAELLLETYQREFRSYPLDCITPIPIFPGRLRQRGYNHAEMLSAILSAETRLPHRPELLRRVKETKALAKLPPRERAAELRGAFQAGADCQGLHILLLDDIYTTGATASEATNCLLSAGAATICVLTVAAGWGRSCPEEEFSR